MITAEDIKRYLAFKEKTEQLSASSMDLIVSAIKFFYQNILKADTIDEQRRLRQDKRLPVVLAKAEIGELWNKIC